MKKLFLILVTIISISVPAVNAAEPDGYYEACRNKSGQSLLTTLRSIVGPHTTVSYDGLWNVYKTSDVRADNTLWDMYSTKPWPASSYTKCGNYKNVGDCVNREHSFPKSWFNEASPMKSDAFHVVPTDGKVNGQRSNYPYGECAGGTTLSSNGNAQPLGRLGTCTFPGYTGKVFEPDDQYKGDFARIYFYMAAAYNDKIANWSCDMLAGNSYPAYKSWVVDMLLKWHRQDPVSQKELDRQEAVYAFQKNRNPFVDHPEMVEYIWGNKQSQGWDYGAASEPAIVLPVSGSTVDMGVAAVGISRSISLSVKGTSLTDNVDVSVAGQGFSAGSTTLTASQVNSTDGAKLTLSYKPSAIGESTGTLTLASGDVNSTVTLKARALEGLPATDATNITDCSFVAHWTYIGNEDSNGCYKLTVYNAANEIVDTYPRSVKASDESYLVDELEPETQYTYIISCDGGLTSNRISVTTGVPVPSVQFLYTDELHLSTAPGEASDAVEVLLDVDNIDTEYTISVGAPFQISVDKDAWTQTVTVDPLEDRIYLRVYSVQAGAFESQLEAKLGQDGQIVGEAPVSASVTSAPYFFEDFEASKSVNAYTDADVQGTAAKWLLKDAGVQGISSEAYAGENYVRMGKTSTSTLTMDTPMTHGTGTVTMQVAPWSAKDGDAEFALEYSTDGGATWETAGTAKTNCSSSGEKVYRSFTFTVNCPGSVNLRVCQSAGSRFMIDNIEATSFTSEAIDGVVSDYNSWDARSVAGELIVELARQSAVRIFGMDGIIRYDSTMSAGLNTVSGLPAGLYIVVVEDFSRRVLVK